MNTLYLHNGNLAVKQWISQNHPNCLVMPCVSVDWNHDDTQLLTWQQKIQFAQQHGNVVTDLTAADDVPISAMIELAQCFNTIKVCTDYAHDLEHLEDVWSPKTYSHSQWLQASILHLWAANEVWYFNATIVLPGQLGEPIVFTPGRTGTHVLMAVLNLDNYTHHASQHGDNFLHSERFAQLTNASNIYSVLRQNLLDQVCSDIVNLRFGPVLTYADNLESNRKMFADQKLTGTKQHIDTSFVKLTGFVDYLLALRMFWHKPVHFFIMEDLAPHFGQIPIMKNPYDTRVLIDNYQWLQDVVTTEYQPVYQRMIRHIQNLCGKSLR
jgi:hypothetical protein